MFFRYMVAILFISSIYVLTYRNSVGDGFDLGSVISFIEAKTVT